MTIIPKSWPKHIRYIAILYLQGMVIFTALRLILLLTEFADFEHVQHKLPIALHAFWNGFRFDTVVSCILLILPFLILWIASLANYRSKSLYKGVGIFVFIGYMFMLMAWIADIPYFSYFNTRLDIFIISRINHPMYIIEVVFLDPINLAAVLACAIVGFFYFRVLRRMRKKHLDQDALAVVPVQASRFANSALTNILIVLILFAGIRGSLSANPIQLKSAYFCDYNLPNQLGLNPVYTFVASYFNKKKIRFMEDDEAVQNAKQYFGTGGGSSFDSPIAREVKTVGPAYHANVVIVVMESMTAYNMGRYGNHDNLTPNLDSLATKGWSFDNFYSSGTHTYQGIFSTMFGIPCINHINPMENLPLQAYSGFPNTLKANGYETAYFTTHQGYRDNIGGFLPSNSIDHFYSQEKYPKDKVEGVYGVPDHYLFHYMIDRCNEMHSGNHPFLATMMTGVNHPPYQMPKNISFVPTAKKERDQFVQYADWAVGEFMKEASQQSWFDSTIFVFVADHGAAMDKTYDLSLSYHHIPCIIYAPKILGQSKVIDGIGSQIDIFPTVMGILNMPYVNNTFGMDLMKQERKFAYFSEDDKVGCVGKNFLYVLRNSDVETLYHFHDDDLKNYIQEKRSLTDSMSTYMASMFQTALWMSNNKKVGLQESN